MSLPSLLGAGRARQFAGLIGCGVAQVGVAVGTAYLVRHSFDAFLRSDQALDTTALTLMLAGFAGIAGALILFRTLERATAEALGQSFVGSVRHKLFKHLLTVPLREFQRRRRGHLMLRFIGDLNALRLWVSQGLAPLLIGSISIAGTLTMLAIMNLRIAAAIGAVSLTAMTVMLLFGPTLAKRVREARRRRSQLAGNLGEKLSSAAVVQAFGRSQKEQRRLRRQTRRLIAAAVSRARMSAIVRVLPEAGATLCVGLVIFVGMFEIERGTATPGTLFATLTVLGLLATPLRDLARVFDYWQNFKVARQKIETFLALPSMERGKRRRAELDVKKGRLVMSGVGIEPGVTDLTVSVEPGATVAIVGPNGGGKSTLLMLAAGLIPPDRGQVTIDGQDLSKCTLVSIRQAVGIMSPTLPLLSGTLGWNLRYRVPDASDEEIARIAARCGIDLAEPHFPAGLESRLQESSRNIPTGLAQRICLARALMGAPPVLLLDEPDSELDTAGRSMLNRVLRDRQGTTLVVTHDPQRLLSTNRVWHVAGGRIVEHGTPAEILACDGPTTRLFGLRPGQLVAAHGVADAG